MTCHRATHAEPLCIHLPSVNTDLRVPIPSGVMLLMRFRGLSGLLPGSHSKVTRLVDIDPAEFDLEGLIHGSDDSDMFLFSDDLMYLMPHVKFKYLRAYIIVSFNFQSRSHSSHRSTIIWFSAFDNVSEVSLSSLLVGCIRVLVRNTNASCQAEYGTSILVTTGSFATSIGFYSDLKNTITTEYNPESIQCLRYTESMVVSGSELMQPLTRCSLMHGQMVSRQGPDPTTFISTTARTSSSTQIHPSLFSIKFILRFILIDAMPVAGDYYPSVPTTSYSTPASRSHADKQKWEGIPKGPSPQQLSVPPEYLLLQSPQHNAHRADSEKPQTFVSPFTAERQVADGMCRYSTSGYSCKAEIVYRDPSPSSGSTKSDKTSFRQTKLESRIESTAPGSQSLRHDSRYTTRRFGNDCDLPPHSTSRTVDRRSQNYSETQYDDQDIEIDEEMTIPVACLLPVPGRKSNKLKKKPAQRN
ncbi:hypothetical protein ABKN59_009579 [Abortiporus biennis]